MIRPHFATGEKNVENSKKGIRKIKGDLLKKFYINGSQK